jgi:hypothetical protein
MRIFKNILLTIFLTMTFVVFAEPSKLLKHGMVRENFEQKIETWNENTKSWGTIEEFWLSHANKQGGLTWGKSKSYPDYSKVKEFDSLLIELPQGLCLMEFYHTRWRRANDVRRWDDAFNEYSACPYVFE